MKQIFLSATLLLVACYDFFGNAHPIAAPPKVVALNNANLRMEPANWWTGMVHNRVEILVQHNSISNFKVRLGQAEKVTLEKVEKGDSPNYLFLTLRIDAAAPPQKVPVIFSRDTTEFVREFPILRRSSTPKAQGVDSRDVLYMIFPDRFANGDHANDFVYGMLDPMRYRDSLNSRHGGDLQGIIDHLDYLQDLGITALWLNPELENDQYKTSYHGYAITDLYRVDRRLGSNEVYRELVKQCHDRGIKVIRDVIPNHIGDQHYWMHDLPAKDWVNQWPQFTRTNARAPALIDPYASEYDKKRFSNGWFDNTMPDLNQRNPHLATYLIQQAIWWVEYAGIDAFRIDTYSYCDQEFMGRWCKALRDEYPSIHLFGEIWEHTVLVQGAFADEQPMRSVTFDSNLPGIIDFQLCFAMQEALTREQGWTDGVSRLYYTLAQDGFYQNPQRNVIMLDNHDMTRFFSLVNEDLNKFKSGLAMLLTLRGIPQLYYGTEILMTGQKAPNHDDFLRKDFPGGFPRDRSNKFRAADRSWQEQEAFDFTRTLIRYRNATPALQTGKLMQFAPEDGVYVYFRYDAAKTVMVVLNTAAVEKTVDTARFAERMSGFSQAQNVLRGETLSDVSKLTVGKNSVLVLELVR